MILLIVEDNLSLAMFTSRNILIERPHWKTLVAGSCFEARNIIEHILPDAVLIDLGLPDGNGLDLLFEFHMSHKNLPVLITSASVSEKLRTEVTKRGGAGLIEKPFDVKDLVVEVEKISVAEEEGDDDEQKEGEDSSEINDDISHYSPWTYSPHKNLDFHKMQNRLSGLLSGLRALGADMRAVAGDEDAVCKTADEYIDRLCGIVNEVSRMVSTAKGGGGR